MGANQSKSARCYCYNLVIKKDWDGVRDFLLSESSQQLDPKEQVKEASVSALSDNKDGDDTNADDEWCVDAYVHGYGYTMLENEHEHDVMHVDDSTSEHDDDFMNNILYQNEYGNTTLIQAIRHEAPIDIIASLIDKGGNDLVMMKDNYGRTAVYHICYMNLCSPTNELKMKETMKLLFNVNHTSSRSSINGGGGGELALALTGIDQDGFSELDNVLAWGFAANGRAGTIVTNAIICQFRTLLELSSGSTIVSTSTCAPKHTHNRHTHSGESGDDNDDANANTNANALKLKLTVPMLKCFVQLQQQPSCEYNGDECEHSQSQSKSDVFFTMTDKEGRTLMQLMAANHPSANVIGYVFKEGLVKKGETKYRQNYNHTNIRSEWTALLERAVLDDHHDHDRGVYVESQLEQSKKSDDAADTHADVDQHELQSCYGHLWDLVDGEYWEAVRIFMTSTNIATETEIRKKNVFYQSKKLRKKHIYVNEKCKKPRHYVLDYKYGDEEDTPLHLAAKRLAPTDIFQKLLDVGGRELALLHNRDCKTAYELVCENQNQNTDQNQQDENDAGAAPRQIMQLLQDFMFPLKNAKKCPPLSKPNMNIQVGDRDSKQCLANGEEWIDMIPPDNITRSVVEGALELALQVARYGVGEGMRANKGFMVLIRPASASACASASEGADVITGAYYVVDIGYCDEGNNNMFKGKQIDVRKWRDFEDVIMPSFLKDGAIYIDGATGMIDTDGFMIDLSTRGAHPCGGPGYRQVSAAGAKGYVAIKWSEDSIYCSTDGIGKHELKVFAGTKEPTFVPVKHCMHM